MRNGRLSVKDLVGPVLIFFGVLLVVASIALPLYFVDNLEKTPMDLDSTTVSRAQRAQDAGGSDQLPATVFNQCSLKQKKFAVNEAALTQQQRIVAVEPASSQKVTLQVGTSVNIDRIKDGDEITTPTGTGEDGSCLAAVLSATIDRVTIDRSSSQASSSGGGTSELQIDSSRNTVAIRNRTGLQYRFPYDVDKKTYSYFDQTTRQAFPAKYVDEKKVAGRNTYHFTQDIPETDLSKLTDANGQPLAGTTINKPASWYGTFPDIDPTMTLPATLFYTAKRDLYVDPTTGVIIDEKLDTDQYFRFSGFSDDSPKELLDFRITNIDANFEYTGDTQKIMADEAARLARPVKLWGLWMPIVFGVLGGLFLIAAAFVIYRQNKAEPTTGTDLEHYGSGESDHDADDADHHPVYEGEYADPAYRDQGYGEHGYGEFTYSPDHASHVQPLPSNEVTAQLPRVTLPEERYGEQGYPEHGYGDTQQGDEWTGDEGTGNPHGRHEN